MSAHRYQVLLHSDTGLPEDDCENVLYFATTVPDDIEGTCDGIKGAYQNLNGRWSSTLSGDMTIKAYNIDGGQPVFQKDYDDAIGLNASSGPREVAVCLSYATVDDPESSTARRRGRIYIGPLGPAVSEKVDDVLQGLVLDMGEELATVGFAGNTEWVMYSRTDDTTAKIEVIWTDDAWDTQRRRGLRPTARHSRDVQ